MREKQTKKRVLFILDVFFSTKLLLSPGTTGYSAGHSDDTKPGSVSILLIKYTMSPSTVVVRLVLPLFLPLRVGCVPFLTDFLFKRDILHELERPELCTKLASLILAHCE